MSLKARPLIHHKNSILNNTDFSEKVMNVPVMNAPEWWKSRWWIRRDECAGDESAGDEVSGNHLEYIETCFSTIYENIPTCYIQQVIFVVNQFHNRLRILA